MPQLTTIEVDQSTAALIQALKERAITRGVTVDALLRPLVESEEPAENGATAEQIEERPFYETATPEEWSKAFLEWANGLDYDAPGLTLEDVSRESIYEDR